MNKIEPIFRMYKDADYALHDYATKGGQVCVYELCLPI